MSIYLLHCAPDARALAAWATRHRLLSPDGDEGYALHALLTAAFGAQAPKPFRYLGGRQGLLAYGDQPPDTLHGHAALATPDVARALGLDSLAIRTFPSSWRSGQTLSFEVRVRPVIRTRDGRERDVFLTAIEDTSTPKPAPDREAVYIKWLGKQFAEQDGAQMLQVGMTSFRLSRVVRRGDAEETGLRRACAPSGPDAVFNGTLRIGNGNAFQRLLARGIGRHRAFGFGMLLLRPAHPC